VAEKRAFKASVQSKEYHTMSVIGQQNDLTTSMERLSSGLRINSAQITGLNQVNDNLQRVRELTVQPE
jgi:flagellin-like hook-associated protein FlgL